MLFDNIYLSLLHYFISYGKLPLKGDNNMPAPIPNRKNTQLRINETLYEKIKVIADRETRNINAQMEHFIKIGVENYEKEHGSVSV